MSQNVKKLDEYDNYYHLLEKQAGFCVRNARCRKKSPVMSANARPIGMEIQIPATPSEVAEKRYASTTRIPREMAVRTTDIPARLTAR